VSGPIRGDFGAFGVSSVGIDLPAAPSVVRELAGDTVLLEPRALDHGAMVPLWFVQEAGWRGPTAVIALPWVEGGEAAMGEAIARASGAERWAVLASGDMSHQLQPGAPSGFDPRARTFDETFVRHVAAGDLRGAAAIDAELRALAAEDVVASVAIGAAAAGWRSEGHRLIAYEGPFGVGYCEAVLYAEAAA
jgi:aromatic ring-opening dioxygenase LigB subunit